MSNSNTKYNNEKENDFYLINTSKYIGLKNSNSKLFFFKNTDIGVENNININSYNNILKNNNNLSITLII